MDAETTDDVRWPDPTVTWQAWLAEIGDVWPGEVEEDAE